MNTSKLTLKTVRDELAKLNVTIRKNEHAEYVVRIKGSPVGHGYFTNDLNDALATGKSMAKSGATIKIWFSSE